MHPASGLRIAAVVVAYNGRQWLSHCLRGLLSQSRPLDEIIVIDNASADDTDQIIGQFWPRVRYCRARHNYGAGAGYYLGLRLAHDAGHDWVWCLDQDCVPERDALEALVESSPFRRREVGLLASGRYLPSGERFHWPALVFTRLPRVVDFKWLFSGPRLEGSWSLLSLPTRPPRQLRKYVRITKAAVVCRQGQQAVSVAACFSGLLVGHSALAKAGYPDLRYGHHGADLEWTFRLCLAEGFAFVPVSRIVDIGPQNTSLSPYHVLHTELIRNYLWYLRATGQRRPLGQLLVWLFIVGFLSRVFSRAFRRGEISPSVLWQWIRASP